jgi:hypothetical protein
MTGRRSAEEQNLSHFIAECGRLQWQGVRTKAGERPQQVYTWRRLARDGALVVPSEGALGFVPVIAAESEPAPSAARPSDIVEIEITGTVIRFAPGVDWRHLRDVLRAVKAAR